MEQELISGEIYRKMANSIIHEHSCKILYFFQTGVDLSYRVSFDPHGTGADLWGDLHEDGKLNSTDGKIGIKKYSSLCALIVPKISIFPSFLVLYSKTCVKPPLKNRQNKDLNDKL